MPLYKLHQQLKPVQIPVHRPGLTQKIIGQLRGPPTPAHPPTIPTDPPIDNVTTRRVRKSIHMVRIATRPANPLVLDMRHKTLDSGGVIGRRFPLGLAMAPVDVVIATRT